MIGNCIQTTKDRNTTRQRIRKGMWTAVALLGVPVVESVVWPVGEYMLNSCPSDVRSLHWVKIVVVNISIKWKTKYLGLLLKIQPPPSSHCRAQSYRCMPKCSAMWKIIFGETGFFQLGADARVWFPNPLSSQMGTLSSRRAPPKCRHLGTICPNEASEAQLASLPDQLRALKRTKKYWENLFKLITDKCFTFFLVLLS